MMSLIGSLICFMLYLTIFYSILDCNYQGLFVINCITVNLSYEENMLYKIAIITILFHELPYLHGYSIISTLIK